MIVTVYTKDGEHYSFLDVEEFTVAGAMEITGTTEVDFGKDGFRFKEVKGEKDVSGSEHKET